MAKCLICGEPTELDFTEFCNSCFELDLDDLMKKFLEFKGKEGDEAMKGPCKQSRLKFFDKFLEKLKNIL